MKKSKHLTTLEFLKSMVNKEFRFSYQLKSMTDVFIIKTDGMSFWIESKDRWNSEWQYHASLKIARKGISVFTMFCGNITEKMIARKHFVLLTEPTQANGKP